MINFSISLCGYLIIVPTDSQGLLLNIKMRGKKGRKRERKTNQKTKKKLELERWNLGGKENICRAADEIMQTRVCSDFMALLF